MTTKKELPKDIAEAFDAKADAAHDAQQNGDIEKAESLYLDAWNLLPDPKVEYDFYPQVYSRIIVEFYRDSSQPTKAEEWLKVVREAYAPLKRVGKRGRKVFLRQAREAG